MQLRKTLTRALIGADEGYDPFECRVCGTSFPSDPGACPACGSVAIVEVRV